MKRILFALLCVACTGTAWAQNPMPNPPQPTATVTGIQQVSGGRIFGGPACGAPSCCAPSCGACCTPTKTICVPEPATKVTVNVSYSSACGKICFPKCSFFSPSSCDSGCSQGNCGGRAYQKNYLVKQVCVTECPTTKCVPVVVPVCETGRIGILHQHNAAPVCVEPTPMKK